MAVKPVPDGYHTVTPYLAVPEVAKLIEFVERAFDAVEVHHRMKRPDGTIMHAEVKIGDSMVMMGEPMGCPASPVALYLYVPDTDAVYRKAIAAGGTSLMEPADRFYGDRKAGVTDPCGNMWWIGTHKEDVPPEEMDRRAAEFMKQQAAK